MAANRLEQARATLGVSEANSMDEAKKAYRAMMLKTHPDKNPDDPEAKERFRQVVDAWDIIQMCNNNDEEYDSCDAEGDYGKEDADEGVDEDMFNEAMQDIFDDVLMAELFSRMRFSHGPPPSGAPGAGKRQHSRRGQRYGRNGGRSQFPFPGMFPDPSFSGNSGKMSSRYHDIEDDDNEDNIDNRYSYGRNNGFSASNASRNEKSKTIPEETSYQSQHSTFAEAAQESCSSKCRSGNSRKKKGKKKGKKK